MSKLLSVLVLLTSTLAVAAPTAAAEVAPVGKIGVKPMVSTREGRTCALLANGTAKCWGLGYLGNGTSNSSNVPVTVSGLAGAVAISVGLSHTCALLANGTAKCWGDDSAG